MVFCQVALCRKFDLESNEPNKSKSRQHHFYANCDFSLVLSVKHNRKSDYTFYI